MAYRVHPPDYLLKLVSASHQSTTATLKEIDNMPKTIQHAYTFQKISLDNIGLFTNCKKATSSIWRGLYLLVDEVNGTAGVYVNKVHFNVAVQQLCTLGHGIGKAAFELRPQREKYTEVCKWLMQTKETLKIFILAVSISAQNKKQFNVITHAD